MKSEPSRMHRLTGWVALIGGILAYVNIALALSVTGDDMSMVFHGPTMLALADGVRTMFRWHQLTDMFGFYLPFVVLGGYFWHRFREPAGAAGDVAALAVALYALLGIAGAAIQQAAIEPLAELHAGGDATVRTAAAATWTGIAHAAQNGLWWSEGPLMLVWALVIAKQSAPTTPRCALLLKLAGLCYGLYFLLAFFVALAPLAQLVMTAGVLLLPLWMLCQGWQMLRQPSP